MTFENAVALGRWLRRRAENVTVVLLAVMFATFIIQIFFRYILNNPIGWSEEVIITMWLWTVLWGIISQPYVHGVQANKLHDGSEGIGLAFTGLHNINQMWCDNGKCG